VTNVCKGSISLPKSGEIELATLWKMELQYYGKITCNFYEKVLAKNIPMVILNSKNNQMILTLCK
jgi:hypothetical protein